ncbi:homoserine kinase [Sodalinema gerasimenkoae]|uniref:homoserine kinase n=1 Tax=Sodalinema gerasimenkoae TaxID=2862348 RepID=UPI0013598FF0|nr:homoserine kinase [Sodalinema gerasimenkoae]
MLHPFTVTVPATTANLGPGFDCLGAALSLHNRFSFLPPPGPQTQGLSESGVTIQVRGEEAARVATDGENLVYQVFCQFFEALGQTPPSLQLEIDLGVPLARGLGSSATAIVGGLLGANYWAGNPLSPQALMRMAIDLEGHPDNVVPALLGGCQLAASDDEDWLHCTVAWHSEIVPVVAIPQFELSTAAARQVLPQEYCRADVVFNTAHLALLVKGLETGDGEQLRVGMQDRVHQPYRQRLIPGYGEVHEAAVQAGAYGLAISGAGPTLLALASRANAPKVVAAMEQAWQQSKTAVTVRSLSLDRQGASICKSIGLP